MVQKLKYAGAWSGVRVPYVALITLMVIFAVSGSVAIDREEGYQLTAGLIAVMQLISIIWPKGVKFAMVSDILTILWFMLWGWDIYTDLYPWHAGLFAVATYPTMAVLVAYSRPIRTRMYHAPRPIKRTSYYGESLSPHFSNIRRSKGG